MSKYKIKKSGFYWGDSFSFVDLLYNIFYRKIIIMRKTKHEKQNSFNKIVLQKSFKDHKDQDSLRKVQKTQKLIQNQAKIQFKSYNSLQLSEKPLCLRSIFIVFFLSTLFITTFCQVQINLYQYCQDQLLINSPSFDLTLCVYPKSVFINQTFLQKIKDSNQVHLRFNFYFDWHLSLFKSLNFISKLNEMFSIDWDGVIPDTLQCTFNQNANYEHGLFTLKFKYNLQWSGNIKVTFSPEKSTLLIFKYSNNLKTPDSSIILSSSSDNNLQMYSPSYNSYFLIQYMFFIMIGVVQLLWLLGIFYGKIIVVDLIMGIQIIFSLFLTMGILPTNYSAMVSEKLLMLHYDGIYDLMVSAGQQDRSIYQNSANQFKSFNCSVIFGRNTLLMFLFFFTLAILRLSSSITKKIYSNCCQQNNIDIKKILQSIEDYLFGQFAFYGFAVFLWPGNISSCIYIQFLIRGGQIAIFNFITFLLFNLLLIAYFLLLVKKPKMFGEFTKQLLFFGVERYYYNLQIVFSVIMSYMICFTLSTKFNNYLPLFLIAYSISMICIMQFRTPFKDKTHKIRSIILYSFILLVSVLIQIQNILQNNQISNIFAILNAILLLILCGITSYYLFFSFKLQGIPKFKEWIQNYLKTLNEKQKEKSKQIQNVFNQFENHFKYESNKKFPMNIDYARQYELLVITPTKKKQGQNRLFGKYTTLQDNVQFINKNEEENIKSPKKMFNQFKKQLKQRRMNPIKKLQNNLELCLLKDKVQQKNQQLTLPKYHKKNNQNKQQKKLQTSNHLKESLIKPDSKEFPEQLTTHYNVHKLFQKTQSNAKNQQQQETIQKQQFNIDEINPNFLQYLIKSQYVEQPSEEVQVQNVTYEQWAFQIQRSQRQRDQKEQFEIQQKELKQLQQRERQRRIRWNQYYRAFGKTATNKEQAKKQFKKILQK